jgi:Fe-Mn family superoxide dismutase
MNRRNFVFASSGAAIGSLTVPGIAAEQPNSSPYPDSGLVTGLPKPLRYKQLPGFLSAAQIAPHQAAHYGGALRAFNDVEQKLGGYLNGTMPIDAAALQRVKQLQSSRGNSVLLHELYFGGLVPKTVEPADKIRAAITQRFGSLDKWADDFVTSAKTAAGWAMLVVHPVNGKLYNVVSDEHAQGPLWLSAPLVVIDTYEHAFYIDYQNDKAKYAETFLSFIDWSVAEQRFQNS